MRVLFTLTALAALTICPALAQDRLMSAPPSLNALAKAPALRLEKQAGADAFNDALKAFSAGDYAAARKLAAAQAQKGDAQADVMLGYLFQNGLGGRADIGAALSHYGDAAIKGNADAQIALGMLAFTGDGVWPDYERAAGWFRLAAQQGDARGAVRLGVMFMQGVGVTMDPVAAAHYFGQAAAAGDADGAYYMGRAFLEGVGVPPNAAKAAANFKSAAKGGNAAAAYELGMLYDSPRLGAPDTDKAVKLIRAAAESGYGPASTAMGLIVHRGDAPGVAADWFEKGLREGDAHSALLYAVALLNGDGRDKDPGKAAAIAHQIAAAEDIPAPLKGEALRLLDEISAKKPAPLTLRN
ncbi:MAG: tetratricopeptide repeat protein [Parvularculaceae bacterium]